MGMNVDELRKMLYDMAKAEPKRRFHSLYDKVCRMDLLREAWKTVRSNHGSPGVDGMSIEDVDRESDAVLAGLHSDLTEGRYKPSPLKRVYIPKSNGKMRGLAIPTVRDRIVQAALKMVIEPIFETQFECQRRLNFFQNRRNRTFQNRRLILSTFHYGSGGSTVRCGGVVYD